MKQKEKFIQKRFFLVNKTLDKDSFKMFSFGGGGSDGCYSGSSPESGLGLATSAFTDDDLALAAFEESALMATSSGFSPNFDPTTVASSTDLDLLTSMADEEALNVLTGQYIKVEENEEDQQNYQPLYEPRPKRIRITPQDYQNEDQKVFGSQRIDKNSSTPYTDATQVRPHAECCNEGSYCSM